MSERETILIADDSFAVRVTLAQILSNAGHELVRPALSVDDVKEIVESGTSFSLAFIDGAMPKLGDGKRIAAYIRKHRPEVKIIAFSGNPQEYGDVNLLKDTPASKILEIVKSL